MESKHFSLKYYNNVHRRTEQVIRAIPGDYLEWLPASGKFTPGDLVRHIATIERYLFVDVIALGKSTYAGCGSELAPGLENTLILYKELHNESKTTIESLSEEEMLRNCITPSGCAMPVWKWLRAMLEHEIHHRGQIYTYLSILNVPTPPIFGLTSEQVITLSKLV